MVLRKLLRSAGLALILMPEPFTTPLGLVLLGVSYICAHFGRIDTPHQLRGFIKMYLKEARLHGEPGIIQHKLQTLSETEWRYVPEKSVKCGIDAERLMLRFGKDMTIEFAEPAAPFKHEMKNRWGGYVWPGAAPDLRTTPTANRIIDTSHLSLRYLADACRFDRLTVGNKIDTSKVSLRYLGDAYGGSAKPVEKTVRHTLRRDAGGAADTIKAAKTVRHNFDANRLSVLYDVAKSGRAGADNAIVHSIRQDLHGYVLPSVPVKGQTTVVHFVNGDKLKRHYEKTMPTRNNVPAPVAHAFDPAKVSLAMGLG